MVKKLLCGVIALLLMIFVSGCQGNYKDSKLTFLPSGICIDTKEAVDREKENEDKNKEKADDDREEQSSPDPARSAGIKRQKEGREPFIFTVIGPTLAEKAKETYQIYTQQAYTMEQGLQAVEAATSRNVVTSHVRTLTLGSELSSKGLKDSLFYFYRNPDIGSDTLLTVAYGTTASALIKQLPVDDIGMSSFLFNFFEGANNNLLVEEVNMTSFFKQINNFPYTGFIPTFSLADKRPYWSGLALFQEDRMVAHLNRHDAQLLALVNNVNREAYLPVMEGKEHAVVLIKGKTRIKPSYVKDNWHFNIKTEIKGELLFPGKKAGYLSDAEINKLEKRIAVNIKQQIDKMIFLIQKKYKVDALGLGALAYREDWRKMKRESWQEDFPKAEIKTEVSFNVNKIGEIN